MRLWTAILAGLQVVSGGTVLLELWDSRYVGLFVLVVAGLQVGTVAYTKPGDQQHYLNGPWAPAERRDRHQAKHAVDDGEA